LLRIYEHVGGVHMNHFLIYSGTLLFQQILQRCLGICGTRTTPKKLWLLCRKHDAFSTSKEIRIEHLDLFCTDQGYLKGTRRELAILRSSTLDSLSDH
jgi:hypothetical protein